MCIGSGHLLVVTASVLGLVCTSSSATAQTHSIEHIQRERTETLSREFRKELIEVAEGVFVAVGYGAANAALIVGTDAVVIVDTMYGTEAAEDVRRAFLTVTDKPVDLIVYTHHHSDHIGGAAVFARGSTPAIYARETPGGELPGYERLADVRKARAARQFGSQLPRELKIDGIAPVHRPTGGVGAGKLAPTHRLQDERERLTVAGIELELIAAPGETDDHLLVWLPRQRVLICGDNFYRSFPNLYALRGTPYRDTARWVSSLNLMIQLGSEHLISGHARPISGALEVRKALTDYRDGIEFVLDETLKGMNEGLSPNELAHRIQLPQHLADSPYLQEFYGVIPWAVRSIYDGHLGWFDGNPTHLFPLPPLEEAQHMVALAGSEESLLEAARAAVASGEYQWACQLLDHLMVLDPESTEVKQLKAEALRHLADQQLSANARHYYLTVARELTSTDRGVEKWK